MKKRSLILWITAILLGWLFDLLFWKQSIGINFAIYGSLCVIGGIFVLWIAKLYPAPSSLWLIPPFLFFTGITSIRTEPMTVFLGILFSVFLMGVFAVTFLGGRWFSYSLADYFVGFINLVGSMLARPLRFNSEIRREEKENGKTNSKINLWPIVRGLIIALPIIIVFATLLASADTIFSEKLNAFIKLFFNLENLPEYIFRLFYILVFGYALAGIFLHAATKSKDEKLIGEDKPFISQFLGFTETTIVLGGVIILFTSFVIVQFRYFFGGQVNLGPNGLTDSEYARRGFGELATVAFLSLLLILGLSTISRRDTRIQKRAYSGLSVALVMLVIVILVSAYQRLILNELAHGFFRLRTYSHVFYIWLALLLVAVVILEILHRERAFALAAVIASLGFGISLSLLNVDGFTVRQSVLRATQGYYLNVPDIVSLSTDSVPVLVDEFLAPSLPVQTHEALGAILLCRIKIYSKSNDADMDWRSFTFSSWWSKEAIKKAQPYLEGYSINTTSRPMRIHTPSGGGYYECQNYYGY
jgi:hypothetical protein